MFSWFTHEKQEKKIEHEGDLTVFREAIELAAARREGRECDKRPALVVLGGVLRGVYGGGGVRALERAGLVNGFTSAVGCSTGAPTIAYFLARQAGVGTTQYYEECTHEHFLNIFDKHFVDISFLARMWRGDDGHKKRLDLLALRESPTRAYVSVTPVTSRVSELVALDELRDPVEAIVAACAMPGLYFGDPRLDGTEYADGAITEPFPVRQLVNMEDPTSILVFMNRTKDEDDAGVGLWLYDRYVYYVLGRRSHIFVHEKNRRRAEAVTWLRSSGIPFCMVYTDDIVQSFTRDSALLSAAADRFEAYVTNLVERARAEKIG